MTGTVTTTEAARILDVSDQTIDNYRKKGILKAFRYHARGHWLFNLSDIEVFKKGMVES